MLSIHAIYHICNVCILRIVRYDFCTFYPFVDDIICTRLLAYWTPISWRYQMLADLFELYEVIQSYKISMLCRNLLSLNSADAIYSRAVLVVCWDIYSNQRMEKLL